MATRAATVLRKGHNVVRISWDGLQKYEEVAFTGGGGDVDVGDTLTQGGVTATIGLVTITSGSLAGSNAAGTLKISARAGGNYGAGAATTTGAGTLTISGIQTVTFDDGTSVPDNWMEYVDRNVQVVGTAGAAFNMVIEGGRDGVTFATLNDAQGVAAAFTAVGVKQIQEFARFMRPRITAGETDVTDVDVYMVLRRDRGGEAI